MSMVATIKITQGWKSNMVLGVIYMRGAKYAANGFTVYRNPFSTDFHPSKSSETGVRGIGQRTYAKNQEITKTSAHKGDYPRKITGQEND